MEKKVSNHILAFVEEIGVLFSKSKTPEEIENAHAYVGRCLEFANTGVNKYKADMDKGKTEQFNKVNREIKLLIYSTLRDILDVAIGKIEKWEVDLTENFMGWTKSAAKDIFDKHIAAVVRDRLSSIADEVSIKEISTPYFLNFCKNAFERFSLIITENLSNMLPNARDRHKYIQQTKDKLNMDFKKTFDNYVQNKQS